MPFLIVGAHARTHTLTHKAQFILDGAYLVELWLACSRGTGREVASTLRPALLVHKRSQFAQQECRRDAAPDLSADGVPQSPSFSLDRHVVLRVRRIMRHPLLSSSHDLELPSSVLSAWHAMDHLLAINSLFCVYYVQGEVRKESWDIPGLLPS